MPTHFFPLTILTQTLEDGTYISEALNFPEISRFHTKEDLAKHNARVNADAILKSDYAPNLYARIVPKNTEIEEINLEIQPPKKTAAWREAVNIKIQYVKIEREDGYFYAYIPALHIAVLSRKEKDFDEKIETEILAALRRDGWTKSLQYLRWLERTESVSIEKNELAVNLPTAKQRAIAEEKDEKEEKPILEEVGTDLTKIKLETAYETEKQTKLLAEIFKGNQKTSVLLVGAAGVGKTAIFNEMVRRRDKLDLKEFRFWTTSGARLIAGQTGFGMWQERAAKLVDEAKKQNAVLHLGNLVELLEVGKSNASTQGIASFLRPKIARGEIVVAVECTPEQLPVLEKRDPNLLSAFQQIRIEEPNKKTSLKILESAAKEFTNKTDADAIKTIDAIHRRYSTYSAFPGRPVRFLRNTFARIENGESLSPAKVYAEFSNETGLPELLLNDEIRLDLEKTEKFFTDKVIGQNEAVKLITDLIATVKAKLTRPRKPIASLLFIGPTGVGKTELTKSLAEFFFSDKSRMIRFDMSEFSNEISVQRLIGGTGEAEGLLTAKVREQPFSVLLLDEFEKAHSSFFDLLLQMLGEGRLTDSVGRAADFTNSIIVMTSNLGASEFQRGKSGFVNNSRQKQASVKHFDSAVRDFLRPEIFNRLDRIVPFAPLDEKTVVQIAELEIEKLKRRDGLRFRPIKLEIGRDVLKHLAKTGYDIRYGARPLKRIIENNLLAPLSAELNLRPTDEKLIVETEVKNDKIVLNFITEDEPRNRKTSDAIPATNAERIAELRRRTQKLPASYRITELNDEIYRIIRLEAAQKRGKWIYEKDQKRIERKIKIEKFLQNIKDFSAEISRMEDKILLEIYGKSSSENEKYGDEILEKQRLFRGFLFELLKLQYENPNTIKFVFFSENTNEIFKLLRLFANCFKNSKSAMTNCLAFTTEKQKDRKIEDKLLFGRAVYRKEIADAERFIKSAPQEIFGVLLEIEGDLALPRFGAETGVHRFIHGARSNRILIDLTDAEFAKYELPEDLTKRDSVKFQTERRVYDLSQNKVKDLFLEKTFSLENVNLQTVLIEAIETNLIKTAENLIS